VRLSGVDAQVSFKGSLTGNLFGLFVKYVLVPTFGVGDVVLLDSLSLHKVGGVFVWFLPWIFF
jgi:hypothetical protein